MNEAVGNNAEQFKQSFREEAREILADLEAALLELNENHGDAELVGRAFRGLHTIKGSGAMFGFERLAAFTHDLETAFDQVRGGRLEVSSELIDLTLEALDQIGTMLDEGVAGKPRADEQICARILERVRRLAGFSAVAVTEKRTEIAAEASAATGPAANAPAARTWHIHFAPGPDMLRCGANPLLLIGELGTLGELKITGLTNAVPPLRELDPERCYFAWDMELETEAAPEAIRDVFIFVEDSCELKIEPAAGCSAPEGVTTAGGMTEPRSARGGRRDYDSPDKASSIRVAAAKLDCFVNLVGELVTVQARLSELAARRDDQEVSEVAEEVERLATALRENSMDMRMMPIRGTFEKFRRLVHDLARSLGKSVELTIEGAETELDKSVIDQLSDPLMHLIRNSMDHGVGLPEERIAHGKPAQASIRLAARYAGASVLISVGDDGRGIDAEAVRAKAIERGLIGPDAVLTDAETYALIFQPGFSTAKEVTDISGRGVGLDVVRRNIDKLRGSIDVTSRASEGTTVTLRLPLTLAIIDGLLVTVGEDYFVLPLANILECIELSRQEIDSADGKHLINVRGEVVPYIRLRDRFGTRNAVPAFEQAVLVGTESGRFGLVVDSVLGNCQTMIKSLGRVYRQVQTLSGATILGNGTVALILDPHRLVEESISAARPQVRGHPRAPDRLGGTRAPA
ncbi:MAG TPA: chemotaxis protein CheA [Terracidiphilus sp.]|nr:chemotaxis protein CheA [Terracidiphilus sp.]